MTPLALITDLSARGVIVTVAGNAIRLDAPVGVLTDADVAALRELKQQVLEHIAGQCRPHNNPANYVDTPAPGRPGWTRTSCRVCGRFVGYRLSGASR
jgi:hypothetical protein